MTESHLRGLPGQGPGPAGDWLTRGHVRADGEGLVHLVAGAEDAPRAAPVIWALEELGAFEQRVIATDAAVAPALAELGVELPFAALGVDRLVEDATRELSAHPPAAILVHGCGEQVLAASIAAARQGLGVVRIGRASHSSAMSRAVARLADFLLVPDEEEEAKLLAAKIAPERVRVVGSPLIGAVRRYARAAAKLEACRAYGFAPEEYVLVVGAAPAVETDLPVLTVPAELGFVERLSLERSAALVLSDSARALEEAAALGVPAGATADSVAIPLWDGRAGKRIAEVVVANFARVDLG